MNNDYLIRVPLDMLQMTDKNGQAWPVGFDWTNASGETEHIEIERIRSCVPFAEQKSGAVGDCYECVIDGRIERLIYSKLQPRKWFALKAVDEQTWRQWYNRSRKEGC